MKLEKLFGEEKPKFKIHQKTRWDNATWEIVDIYKLRQNPEFVIVLERTDERGAHEETKVLWTPRLGLHQYRDSKIYQA